MTKRIFPIIAGLSIAFIIVGIAFAGGGGMGGSMSGGGHGMTGDGHMMQYDPNMANPWQKQPQSPYSSYQNKQTETEKLRQTVRAKRKELSDLYRSENPDKDQINQKIEELDKLEAELDRSLSGS